MRGFLLAMMVLGLVSAAVGCLMFLASLLDVRLAVVFVPPLIATEVMIGFGFLLAATAGGMAEMIRLLECREHRSRAQHIQIGHRLLCQ